MRVQWLRLLQRPDLSAAATVTAVLMAGVLAKFGHAWWAVVVMAGLCLGGGVIEHLTSARRTQFASNARTL
jgi:hypothetical protein